MLSQSLLSGHFEDWHGLPGGLTIERLQVELAPVTTVEPSQDRVRGVVRYIVRSIYRATTPCRVDAWTPYGTAEVFLLECGDPPVSDVPRILDRLGPPELSLTNRRHARQGPVKELVFLSRGLCVSVIAGEAPELVHVQLFPPIPAERYLTEIDTREGFEPNTSTHPCAEIL